MSMFSAHYVIVLKNKFYTADKEQPFGNYLDAIRLHDKRSAERIVTNLLQGVPCIIEEDE